MFVLTVTPAAATMAGNAYLWYEEQQIGLGELFLMELENAFTSWKMTLIYLQLSQKNTVKRFLENFLIY